MTPKKLLIAQRLDESAAELASIANLAEDFKDDPLWAGHVAELRNTAELAAMPCRCARMRRGIGHD